MKHVTNAFMLAAFALIIWPTLGFAQYQPELARLPQGYGATNTYGYPGPAAASPGATQQAKAQFVGTFRSDLFAPRIVTLVITGINGEIVSGYMSGQHGPTDPRGPNQQWHETFGQNWRAFYRGGKIEVRGENGNMRYWLSPVTDGGLAGYYYSQITERNNKPIEFRKG